MKEDDKNKQQEKQKQFDKEANKAQYEHRKQDRYSFKRGQ